LGALTKETIITLYPFAKRRTSPPWSAFCFFLQVIEKIGKIGQSAVLLAAHRQ
jgi:hypothetical protein